MKKELIYFVVLLIISLFFIWQIVFAQGILPARWGKILLGKEDVGFLPTSPFYFIKEWGRNIKKFFTFDSVKKAELELKYTDEILIELAKSVDENCGENADETVAQKIENKCNKAVLEKVLNNYFKTQEKLAKKIESLPQNKNVEELLNKLGERVIFHQALFDEIINNNPVLEKAIREGGKTVGAGQITEIIKRVGGVDNPNKDNDVARKNKAELIDAIAKGGIKAVEKLPYPEGIKELKALEVLTRIKEQLPEEAKKEIETAEEAIQNKIIENSEIQKAGEWEVKQSSSGQILIEGAPIKTKIFEEIVEKIEEEAKTQSIATEKPNIINIEALKELKIKTQKATKVIDENNGKTDDFIKPGPSSQGICPTIAPDASKGKEECLKAARRLDETYPGCNYEKMCGEISKEEPSLDCGPAPAAPGNWKCIDGSWKDISQCGKIRCLRYEPVCGADGKTYACGEADAESCGVKAVYKGECKKEQYPKTLPLPGEEPSASPGSAPTTKLP